MRVQAYYSEATEAESNRQDLSKPLLVNCAGVVYSKRTFDRIGTRRDYYLLCVVAGGMPVTLGEEVQQLKKDSFLIIAPGTRFRYHIENGFINYYWIHFTGSYAGALLEHCGLEPNRVYQGFFESVIRELFEQVFQEYIFRQSFSQVNLSGLLIRTLTQLSRSREHNPQKPMDSIRHINAHYDQPLRLEDLAAMEGLSVSHYRTVFKKATGSTPVEYITRQRVNAACLYLQRYAMTVKEVAFRVGYRDPLYFSKVFKKVTGQPPEHYRQRHSPTEHP